MTPESLIDAHTARGAIQSGERDFWVDFATRKPNSARAVLSALPDGDLMAPVDPWFRITDGWPPIPPAPEKR